MVKTDLTSAFNAYAEQAGDLGYLQVRNPAPHCWSPQDDDAFCTGFFVKDHALLEISAHVCRSCGVPVSEALMEYTKKGYKSDPSELEAIGSPVGLPAGSSSSGFNSAIRLSSSQYSRMLNDPGRGSPARQFGIVRGSSLLAPPTSFANCENDFVGVASIPSNAKRVFHRYARRGPESTRVGHDVVLSATDGSTTWTLVRDPHGPGSLILQYLCSN